MSKSDLPIFSLPAHDKVIRGFIKSLKPGNYRFDVTRVQDQRSLAQNAYLHGVVLDCIAKGLSGAWGYTVGLDEAKHECKKLFAVRDRINPNTGEIVSQYIQDTHEMSKEEMSEFIERIIQWAQDYLGVTVPPARDYEHGDEVAA